MPVVTVGHPHECVCGHDLPKGRSRTGKGAASTEAKVPGDVHRLNYLPSPLLPWLSLAVTGSTGPSGCWSRLVVELVGGHVGSGGWPQNKVEERTPHQATETLYRLRCTAIFAEGSPWEAPPTRLSDCSLKDTNLYDSGDHWERLSGALGPVGSLWSAQLISCGSSSQKTRHEDPWGPEWFSNS